MADEELYPSDLAREVGRRADAQAELEQRALTPAPTVALDQAMRDLLRYADGKFVADPEQRAAVHRLADQWTAVLAQLDALAPGDPVAGAMIDGRT
jgi:hypothetical protein